ncbi:MAG TPA: tRNA (guanosine(37)-N1)-methyltransferase TrmD [Anaerolineales bacterium]|nr:tRNA (guanosine(37)-N1)-methyltransferase TrmD [Anaerolineales bacterium]
MRIDVFTLLSEVMQSYLEASVIGRARRASLLDIRLHNIRDYAHDRHRTTDDAPYGGGGGMLMKPEPIFEAVEAVLGEALGSVPVILLTPQGRALNQSVVRDFAGLPRLALICGRYEGVDERIRERLATDELSIGDYVLTGGELPALVLVDAISRLVPGVLGDPAGAAQDSHATGLLEHPQYTRPVEYRGWRVPEALLSGDHARVAAWRHRESLRRTLLRRPDLLQRAALTDEERATIHEIQDELGTESDR